MQSNILGPIDHQSEPILEHQNLQLVLVGKHLLEIERIEFLLRTKKRARNNHSRREQRHLRVELSRKRGVGYQGLPILECLGHRLEGTALEGVRVPDRLS